MGGCASLGGRAPTHPDRGAKALNPLTVPLDHPTGAGHRRLAQDLVSLAQLPVLPLQRLELLGDVARHAGALGVEDEVVFLSLVSGAPSETLDDGEAATLACATRLGACAVIDERKATSLSARRLTALEVCSTCDLLMGPEIQNELGVTGHADALFAALTGARMRVPDSHAAPIVTLLGARAALCLSIPARYRSARSTA